MTSIIKVQNIQYTDGDAALTIADGGGVTAASTLTSTGAFTSPGIDDNADATSITIDSNENVGIKTTSPSDPLHVKGFAQIESNSGDGNYIRFDNTANSGGKIWRTGLGVYSHPTFSIYNQTDNVFPCNIDTTNSASVIRTFTSINLADDASALQVAEGFQGMVIVSNVSNGLTGIFRIENQNVPQLISGNSSWATSDVDGKLCLIKAASTNNVFFRNRFGATYGFRIMSIGAYQ